VLWAALGLGGVGGGEGVGGGCDRNASSPSCRIARCRGLAPRALTSVQPEDGAALPLQFNQFPRPPLHVAPCSFYTPLSPFARPSCLASSVSAACRAPCALCPLCARVLEASPGCPLHAATPP
jgi:hypothetical protein